MIDWDEVNRTEDEKRLREVKLWLFQENVRLENERRDLEQAREKFLTERIRSFLRKKYCANISVSRDGIHVSEVKTRSIIILCCSRYAILFGCS